MHKIPTHIDDPDVFLVWSSDEFVPAIALIGVGIMTNQLSLMFLVTFLAVKLYRRHRDGHPNGYILHWLYSIGIFGSETRTIRNPYCKDYQP